MAMLYYKLFLQFFKSHLVIHYTHYLFTLISDQVAK